MAVVHKMEGLDRGTGKAAARRSEGGEGVLAALDQLAEALEENARDQEILLERIGELHRARASGMSWEDILSKEEKLGTMQLLSRMLARLSAASGTLRKEMVDGLRDEGVSVPTIARLFGVTHQRVSNLLRRSGR